MRNKILPFLFLVLLATGGCTKEKVTDDKQTTPISTFTVQTSSATLAATLNTAPRQSDGPVTITFAAPAFTPISTASWPARSTAKTPTSPSRWSPRRAIPSPGAGTTCMGWPRPRTLPSAIPTSSSGRTAHFSWTWSPCWKMTRPSRRMISGRGPWPPARTSTARPWACPCRST